MEHEYAFIATSSIRFGTGFTREVGMDLADMGVRRALGVTDPTLARLPPVAAVLESLTKEGISFALFDRVHIEPFLMGDYYANVMFRKSTTTG